MQTSPSPIERFFQTFVRLTESSDIPALVALYSDTFLAVGPQGAKCVRSADFALALPRRRQLFDSLGRQSTSLVSVRETPLDSRYTLVHTQWRFTFGRPAGIEDFLVESTYLVDTGSEPFRILLYLAHQDILALLQPASTPIADLRSPDPKP